MRISFFTGTDSDIPAESLRECTMPSPFEDTADTLLERLADYSIEPNNICYAPNESFSIIGTERDMGDVYGHILFDNSKPITFTEENGKRYQYHRLTFLGLDRRLFENNWLRDTFHTIFNKIIKYNSQTDKSIIDVVWFEYDGASCFKTMDKQYDIYDNMFDRESRYFADIFTQTENAPE